MAKEIETKFKIHSPERLREKLGSIGADFISKGLERDVYYRPASLSREPAGGEGPAAAGISAGTIRLRSVGDKGGVFTLKSRAAGKDEGPYKTRDEFEVRVDDASMFADMLGQLGFVPIFRKEKMRETYKLEDASILLDEVPFIGWYAEIEGPKATIERLAGLLELDMAKAIPDTYMDLFGYYKMRHGKPALHMVFDKK